MQCYLCPSEAHGKDGLCLTCRIRREGAKRTKYAFTEAMDDRLTNIYRTRKSMPELTKNVRLFMRETGWPRHAFTNRAVKLGLRMYKSVRWTWEEDRLIEEMAGEYSVRYIANKLGRSVNAVSHRVNERGMSQVVTSGFTRRQVEQLFGVRDRVITSWIGKGWLAYDEQEHRIHYDALEQFAWKHMDDYEFPRCEQWFLKKLLKPHGYKIIVRPGPKREEAA